MQLRLLLSAFAGSAVHRMTAANGSLQSSGTERCERSARAGSIDFAFRPSTAHQATKPYTALRYP
jgi:hypothetical protein